MASALERSLIVLETLANFPEGCALSALADAANMPASAAHRLLADLSRCGYVRQERDHGHYRLTMKLTALGLNFLNRSGIIDIVQPSLDRLAEACGELVRLAVVDGDELIFVAKAQGSKSGLRYDPDMGLSVPLSCSAAGHAWLSTMPEGEALERVARQGFGRPQAYGRTDECNGPASLPSKGRDARLQSDRRSVRARHDRDVRSGAHACRQSARGRDNSWTHVPAARRAHAADWLEPDGDRGGNRGGQRGLLAFSGQGGLTPSRCLAARAHFAFSAFEPPKRLLRSLSRSCSTICLSSNGGPLSTQPWPTDRLSRSFGYRRTTLE
jgi:predicted transcriptional regulator